MRRVALAVSLMAVLLVTVSAAQSVPKLVTFAKYVYVTTPVGAADSYRVAPQDRQAVAEVNEAIEKWGRYKTTLRREEADLVVEVRRGKYASGFGGVHVGSQGSGPVSGGEAGRPEDMLAIYDAHLYPDTSPIYRDEMKDGLGMNMPLFERFKKQVEKADKADEKKKKP